MLQPGTRAVGLQSLSLGQVDVQYVLNEEKALGTKTQGYKELAHTQQMASGL